MEELNKNKKSWKDYAEKYKELRRIPPEELLRRKIEREKKAEEKYLAKLINKRKHIEKTENKTYITKKEFKKDSEYYNFINRLNRLSKENFLLAVNYWLKTKDPEDFIKGFILTIFYKNDED